MTLDEMITKLMIEIVNVNEGKKSPITRTRVKFGDIGSEAHFFIFDEIHYGYALITKLLLLFFFLS